MNRPLARIALSVTFALLLALPAQAAWISTYVQGEDIGNPLAGNSTHTLPPTVITTEGAGNDIWGTSDSFHYYYGTWTGDFDMIARVVSQENTNSWAKAGPMIRETTAANSRHLITAVTPGNGTHAQRRESTGGGSSDVGLGGPNSGTGNLWVRLEGTYNAGLGTWDLQPYRGTNTGAAPGGWTAGTASTITMGSNIQLGLANTSHNSGSLSTVVFDNVTVNGSPLPLAPLVTAELSIQSAEEPYLMGKAFAQDGGTGAPLGPVNWTIERGTPVTTNGVLRSEWYLGNQTWSGTPEVYDIAQLSWNETASSPGYPPETPYSSMDNYSVRVSGEIYAPETREYNFAAYTDDYCRLTIDSYTLVDDGTWTNWAGSGGDGGDFGSIILQGGQWYSLEYLMTEGNGGDNARLLWDWDANTGQPTGGGYLDVESQFYRSTSLVWNTIAAGTGNVGSPTADGSFGIFLDDPDMWDLRLNVSYTDPFVTVSGGDAATFVGVPEPASMALLGLGLAAIARRRKK